MQNHWTFSTQGTWETTTLLNDGEEVLASRLFLRFRQARNLLGRAAGGEMEGTVTLQDEPDSLVGLFPGTIEFDVPNHKIVVDNRDPHFAFESTKVFYQDLEVTPDIAEVYFEIDADQNVVQAYISLFQGSGFGHDKAETFAVL